MEDGLRLVSITCFTLSSFNIPIQIVLKPSADAASWEYAAASVASCNENLAKISGLKFILTLDGSIQNTKTSGALTYGWLFAASTSLFFIFLFFIKNTSNP